MPCYDHRDDPSYIRSVLLGKNSKLSCWWRDHQIRDRKVADEKADKERKRVASVKAQIKKLEDSLKN